MRMPLRVITTSLFALSACGGALQKSAPAVGTSSFKATDACAILSREKVAAATGLKIQEAKLSSVTPATASTPGFSACTYVVAERGTLGFYARQSSEADTPQSIAPTRKVLTDGMGAKIADVAGIGTTVFSAQPMDQLHVFFGGDKYIYFMIDRAPIVKLFDVERTLANAVIG